MDDSMERPQDSESVMYHLFNIRITSIYLHAVIWRYLCELWLALLIDVDITEHIYVFTYEY